MLRPILEHLDLVVNFSIRRGIVLGAPRLQGGDFDELPLAQQPAQQVGDERWRLSGSPRLRERHFAWGLRQLDFPDAEAVLDPPAESNSSPRETAIGGVVIGGRKDAAHAARS